MLSNDTPEPFRAAKICSGSCPCSCSSPCVCECPRMECEWVWGSFLPEVAECSGPFSSLFFLFTAFPWGFFVEWDRICCMLERRSCVGRPLNLSANAFCHDIPRSIRVLDITLPLTTNVGGVEIKPRPIICLNILGGLQGRAGRLLVDWRPNNRFMTCEVKRRCGNPSHDYFSIIIEY